MQGSGSSEGLRLEARRVVSRTIWLMVGGAIGLAAALLLVGFAQVLGSAFGGPSTLLIVACLLPVGLIGLLPGVRDLEVTAARALLATTAELIVPTRLRPAHRARTVTLVALHLILGLLAATILVGLAPGAVALTLAAVQERSEVLAGWSVPAVPPIIGILLGAAAVASCLAAVWGLGRVAAGVAPRLLGPTPADRLEVAYARLAAEAEHIRLARDLHDGIGHALTIMSLQAAAGQCAVREDPAQAEAAFEVIAGTARRTLGDLDTMLGLLRDPDRTARSEPDLDDLESLVEAYRSAGTDVVAAVEVTRPVPQLVATAAYRVVAEGLANAARYGAAGPVRLDLLTSGSGLSLEVRNALSETSGVASSSRRGRGLTGITEQVAVFGGRVEAGPHAGT